MTDQMMTITTATKTEAIQMALRQLLNEKRPIDVGKGAESYFRASQTTLNRAIKRLYEQGKANLFYIQAERNDGKKVVVKLLTPAGWSFAKTVKQRANILSLVGLRSSGAKLKADLNDLSRRDIATIGTAVNALDETEATPERKQEIIEGVKKQVALRSLDAPKSMLNHRIRQLKKRGYSNRAIGTVLDISESTVRRRLKTPLEPMETLLDKILGDLEDAREEIIGKFSDYPEIEKIFGEGYGDGYILRVHTNARKAEISEKLKRVKFTLEFVVAMKNVDGE